MTKAPVYHTSKWQPQQFLCHAGDQEAAAPLRQISISDNTGRCPSWLKDRRPDACVQAESTLSLTLRHFCAAVSEAFKAGDNAMKFQLQRRDAYRRVSPRQPRPHCYGQWALRDNVWEQWVAGSLAQAVHPVCATSLFGSQVMPATSFSESCSTCGKC